jgi:ATP phosphoribosyltransferase
VIVDITTTGATLRANGLKVLDDGVILKSEASLTRSVRAPWNEAAEAIAASLLRQPRAGTKRPI